MIILIYKKKDNIFIIFYFSPLECLKRATPSLSIGRKRDSGGRQPPARMNDVFLVVIG